MPRRPALTLIYVSRQTVARADFGGGRAPALAGRWDQPRPELPDIASTVEYALSLGPRPGRAVWVLATDLWTQTLALPMAKAAGLKPDALAQALNFEAESLSGIPAVDATVGVVSFPASRGEQPCWLVQVRTGDIDAVAEAVRRAGAAFAGMTHPGGLPECLTDDPNGPFERIELWPDAVLGVRRSPEGKLDLRVWNTDPPLGRWQPEVGLWLASGTPAGNPETLTAENFAEPKDRPAPVVRLDDPQRLGAWFEAWAAELAVRTPSVPIVRPLARSMAMSSRVVAAVVLAALVAGACYGHFLLLDRQHTDLKAAIAKSRPDTKSADEIKRLVTTRTEERDKLRTEKARLEGVTARLEQSRERFARLLEVLASEKPEDVFIQRIEQEGPNPKVVGVALRPDLAHDYAQSLYEELRPLGWEVQPAKETDLKKQPGGGPWSFEVLIRDVPLVTGSVPPLPRKAKPRG